MLAGFSLRRTRPRHGLHSQSAACVVRRSTTQLSAAVPPWALWWLLALPVSDALVMCGARAWAQPLVQHAAALGQAWLCRAWHGMLAQHNIASLDNQAWHHVNTTSAPRATALHQQYAA